MQNRVVIGAVIAPHTAFGRLAEVVLQGLHARGVSVGIKALNVNKQFGAESLPITQHLFTQENPNFHIGPAGDLAQNCDLSDALVMTAWETDKLPAKFALKLNRAQLIIVPSKWCKEALLNGGVTTPIRVIPHGIDTGVFRSDFRTFPKRVFLTAGRGARKGLDTVILAFLKAFPYEQDVLLQVKTHPDCPVVDVCSPRVQLIKAHLCVDDLVRWYREGLCFVSGSVGEGFGLHLLEAMACNCPIIAPSYGGPLEFFQGGDVGWEVKYKTRLAESNGYYITGRVGEPDLDSMVDAMRRVYAAPHLAFLKGVTAAQVAQRFTEKRMVDEITQYVRQTILSCGRPGRSNLRPRRS